MIATRHLCVGLLTILVLAGANGQTPQPTTLPAGSATIADLKGDVQIHSPQGESVNAQRGTALAAESKIDTAKGSVLLNLEDGSQVLVKSNSHGSDPGRGSVGGGDHPARAGAEPVARAPRARPGGRGRHGRPVSTQSTAAILADGSHRA